MTQQFSDEARIRKYLLGDLSEEACKEIETLLLTDKTFSEQVSFSRTEMVDDYVAANLSAKERQDFERHFLSTPEHFQMVEISRALAKRLEERSRDWATTDSGVAANLTPYYFRHMKAIVLTAGVILLLTGYAVWEIVKQKRFDDQVIDAHQQRAILESELSKLNQLNTSPTQTALAVVTLNLKPILVREFGENRSFAVSKEPRIFELRLELPSNKYQIYRASLQTDQGRELAGIDALTAESLNNGSVVVIKLPSWLMRPGSYQIKLTGALISGQYEDVSSYPFEITSK